MYIAVYLYYPTRLYYDLIVQLYVKDIVSSLITYDSQLRGFERISLQPGEKRSIKFMVRPDDLALTDKNMKWIVEPGKRSEEHTSELQSIRQLVCRLMCDK